VSEELADLDPGIGRLVRWLQRHGFNTTDSGDGVTKTEAIAAGEALAEPHVFMTCNPGVLVIEAERLAQLVREQGLPVVQPGAGLGAHVNGSYEPVSGVAVLALFGLCDATLPRSRPE
jgi:hypothetical protein